MSKKRIKRTKPPKASSSRIYAIPVKDQLLNFSFKYYQADHEKFNLKNRDSPYLLTLLARLKAISGLSTVEFLTNRSSALRCHPIRWSDTSETGFGLPGEEQLVDIPYQFSLSSNEYGRVHGFMIGSTFYVVWFDSDHLLYSS